MVCSRLVYFIFCSLIVLFIYLLLVCWLINIHLWIWYTYDTANIYCSILLKLSKLHRKSCSLSFFSLSLDSSLPFFLDLRGKQ
uniref:Uncharacterized protein n=1 Tax=Octopus bimaculoides TaxID=37653 RepID=A0A0L8HB63_OCTBM